MAELTGRQAESARFGFGANWRVFLGKLTEEHLKSAEEALARMLGITRLDGVRFLDIGSGSGLSSLAARRLGAKVCSFDYDRDSVDCTRRLKEAYYPDDNHWELMQGDVLDLQFMQRLGDFDVVYSWGVLHHTGQMWTAIENAMERVRPEGSLFIAIYNDQGPTSQRWRAVKRLYVSGTAGRLLVKLTFLPAFMVKRAAVDLVRGRNPVQRYRDYKSNRGMSLVTDWIDWLGGYPFEVAKPEEVFEFAQARAFRLVKLITRGGGIACNEYVFTRSQDCPSPNTCESRTSSRP